MAAARDRLHKGLTRWHADPRTRALAFPPPPAGGGDEDEDALAADQENARAVVADHEEMMLRELVGALDAMNGTDLDGDGLQRTNDDFAAVLAIDESRALEITQAATSGW